MLLEMENRTMESVGVQQVARATIKASRKVFNFFADATYANKPRAICRELCANAVDSHVMAGKADVPVEVWLPTILDPTFKVVDHGLGMSHEFVMGDFMAYADGSQKDGSNIAIGGFGIGSKSPFSYVDQFTIVSRFDGTESVYSVFKDSDGIPSIGLLGQRPTSEPNGVSVEFPVKPEDFETFEEAAFEALRFFEPLPDIRNATEGKFNPPEYVARGKTWGMRPESGNLQIIMGGVMYPVNASNLTYKFPDDSAARKLLGYGLDLRVPIGTCSVALSREALSYDDRTIEGLRVACETVIEEVAESMSTIFDHIDNEWEAKVALYKEIGGAGYWRSERSKFLAENARWKGQPFGMMLEYPMFATRKSWDGKDYPVAGYDIWEIASREQRSSRRAREGYTAIGPAKWETPDKYGFTPGEVAYLIIDDLPPLPKHKAVRKIKEFAEEEGKRCLVVRPHEDQSLDPQDIVRAFGSPPADQVVLTSTLPEPIMERTPYGKMLNRPKVRMFRYTGCHQRTTSWRQPSYRVSPERDGVTEIPYADQPTEGILVVMENFIPPAGDIRQKVDSGLLSWNELLFVNRADAKKLKGFETYEQAFERRKKEKLAAYPDLAKRLALSHSHELSYVFDFFRSNSAVDFSSRKPLGQIYKLYKEYVEPLDDDQRRLARFVEAKLPRGVKPEELRDNFKEKQPRAYRLMQLLPSHLNEEDLKLFQENL